MKLSVIIPSYNRPRHLEKCVDCIFKNTISPFEIVIVDDCSVNPDEYYEVITNLKQRFDRLRYIRLSKNSGAPKARNIGASSATGEYILFCDDDDYWYSNHLAAIYKVLSDFPNTHFVYSGTDVIEGEKVISNTFNDFDCSTVTNRILKHCFIASPSVCINRTKFLQLGGFDKRFHSCQDWDLWTRVILDDPNIKFTGLITTAHVVHNGERIGFSKNAWKGYLQYYTKHFRSFFYINKALLFSHFIYILYHLVKGGIRRIK